MRANLLLFVCAVSGVLLLGGCSSTKTVDTSGEKLELQRDYKVTDASGNVRPAWIELPYEWAKDAGNKATVGDPEKSRYFAFETTPKIDREVACDLAKANAKADIASEIATFIEKSLGFSKEGAASVDADQATGPLREFVEVTLAEKTKALVHGATIVQTYWEKRQYLMSLGAKKDYIGYTCAVLVKMDRDQLQRLVNEAADHVVRQVDDPATKENVKNALKDASTNFDRAIRGEI